MVGIILVSHYNLQSYKSSSTFFKRGVVLIQYLSKCRILPIIRFSAYELTSTYEYEQICIRYLSLYSRTFEADSSDSESIDSAAGVEDD